MAANVERIWRVTTEAGWMIEVRLTSAGDKEPKVLVERLSASPDDEVAFDLEVARALAQALLEASEVASALREQVAAAY
jgi:hypothetical protein